jgi:hypothetical protein
MIDAVGIDDNLLKISIRCCTLGLACGTSGQPFLLGTRATSIFRPSRPPDLNGAVSLPSEVHERQTPQNLFRLCPVFA